MLGTASVRLKRYFLNEDHRYFRYKGATPYAFVAPVKPACHLHTTSFGLPERRMISAARFPPTEEFACSPSDRFPEHVKHRNQEQSDTARSDHADEHRRADSGPRDLRCAGRHISGTSPRMNAIDVIRNRISAPRAAASFRPKPCPRCSLANSTIRVTYLESSEVSGRFTLMTMSASFSALTAAPAAS